MVLGLTIYSIFAEINKYFLNFEDLPIGFRSTKWERGFSMPTTCSELEVLITPQSGLCQMDGN